MNEARRPHPGAETMAALLEGRLAPGELAETTAHLRDCADCRTILGESARFEAEESGGQAILPVPLHPQDRQDCLSSTVITEASPLPTFDTAAGYLGYAEDVPAEA